MKKSVGKHKKLLGSTENTIKMTLKCIKSSGETSLESNFNQALRLIFRPLSLGPSTGHLWGNNLAIIFLQILIVLEPYTRVQNKL